MTKRRSVATNAAALKAELAKAKAQRKEAGGFAGEENSAFKFWDLPLNATAKIRFLPDANEDNPFVFLEEKKVIKLPFPSIKGVDNEKGIPVLCAVPTMSAFGKKCPILKYASEKFEEAKTTGNEETRKHASQYWSKVSGLAQCFVIDAGGIEEVDPPENPIRKLFLNKGLFEQIKNSLLDFDDDDPLPCDYENGTNYNLRKTQQGNYNSYTSSGWDRKESSLTDEQLAAVDKYGLFNLNDMLFREPDETQQGIIMEMFEASKAGEPYDPERFAGFYRPFGVAKPDGGSYEDKFKTTSPTGESVTEKPKPQPPEAKEPVPTPQTAEAKATEAEQELSKTESGEKLLADIKNLPKKKA